MIVFVDVLFLLILARDVWFPGVISDFSGWTVGKFFFKEVICVFVQNSFLQKGWFCFCQGLVATLGRTL